MSALSPSALESLRQLSEGWHGPNHDGDWNAQERELIETEHIVVAALERAVRLPRDGAPRQRALLLTDKGWRVLNAMYASGAWGAGDAEDDHEGEDEA